MHGIPPNRTEIVLQDKNDDGQRMEASAIKVVDGSNKLGLSVETTAVRPSNKNLANSAILPVFDRFRQFFFAKKGVKCYPIS